MEIFVHIGLHKTASTFLQSILFPSLEECCVLTRKELCHFKQYVLNEGDFTFDPAIAREIFLKVLDEKNNYNSSKIIISDEDFSGMPFMGAIDRKMITDRLVEIFSEYELKIIVFLRNQESLLKSIYLQYIKTGGSISVKNFLESSAYPLIHNNNYYNISAFLEYYKAKLSVSNICVLLFEEFVSNKVFLVEKLIKFIGVNSSKIDFNITKNMSLSYWLVSPMIFLNSITKSYKNIHGLLPFKFYRLYTFVFLRWSRWLPMKRVHWGFSNEELNLHRYNNRSLVDFVDVKLLTKHNYL